MKKRLSFIGLSFLLGLSLASCSPKKENIGIFLYDSSDTFISSLKNNLISKLGNNYNITVYDSKKSQSIQNNQIIEEISNNNLAYLIVNMVDRLSSSSIIQKANQTNTPVIFFNREPVYTDIKGENAYYVGTDPKIEGINQGIMAEELMKSPTKISKTIDKNGDNKLQCVFIQGEPNHQDTEMRTYSCINYLQEKGFELDILTMESADWNKEKGFNVMQNIYTKYGNDIEFVFSNNDDMALGAIEYLLTIPNNKKNNTILPFPIVGVDGTEAGLKSINDGYLYGTTINDSLKQADAISMLIKVLRKEISIDDLKKNFEMSKDKDNYLYVSGKLISQINK